MWKKTRRREEDWGTAAAMPRWAVKRLPPGNGPIGRVVVFVELGLQLVKVIADRAQHREHRVPTNVPLGSML